MSRYGRPTAVNYSFGPRPMTFAVKAITTKTKGDEFKRRMVALVQPDLLGIERAKSAGKRP